VSAFGQTGKSGKIPIDAKVQIGKVCQSKPLKLFVSPASAGDAIVSAQAWFGVR
jgi:hypothetical protein